MQFINTFEWNTEEKYIQCSKVRLRRETKSATNVCRIL